MTPQPEMFAGKLIVILLVVAVFTSLVVFFVKRRPRAGLAVLAVAILFFLLVIRYMRMESYRIERERETAVRIVARSEGPRIECADDLSRWQRDAVLDFEPVRPEKGGASEGSSQASGPQSIEDGTGARRQSASVDGTNFLWWEPGETGELAAFSGPEASEALAREEALALARRKLAVLALLRLKREAPGLDALVALPLALRLAAPRVAVEDVLVERASRAYGEIYRAAVRIDAAAPRISALQAAIQAELGRGWAAEQARLRRWFVTGASLVVFAVGLFLAYAFLNAGTKGYFAWPLRIASAAVFVLLVFAVFYLRAGLGLT